MDQREVPIVVMRGGTSRGLFLHERDLPAPGAERDRIFNELMGSPHPLQVDGLGGTYSSNSKIMVVARSARPGVDVEYEFGQLSAGREHVDYRGNCGNLTAAVGPFAIDEGLVAPTQPTSRLTLLNRNTGVRIVATVPVADGMARVVGDTAIEGLAGTGAPIGLSFLDPGGSVCGSVLPTGHAIDHLQAGDMTIDASIVDVSSPVVFVRATDVGLRGSDDPRTINGDATKLAVVEELRSHAAELLGFVSDRTAAESLSPSQPKVAICASPATDDPTGPALVARIFSMGRMHHAFTVTGLLCLAAAAQMPRTIPHELRRGAGADVRVDHAGGVTDVSATVRHDGRSPVIESVSITRTARRIMRGVAYVRTPTENRT